ncbi:protein kinase [Streptomyces sp. NPDC050504]|uniref:protein kinase domain-containing protein n=1 Tax=Streptomyces sp. NPDC050504 TaxID=3365618 RepID=UPI0037B31A53
MSALGVGAELRNGRYVLDAVQGEGGMATVYRARDTALGRTVAIKVMSGALGGDESFGRRFQREARTVAALSHPHVVAVHDIGEHEVPGGVPVPYLVMEFVEGESLRERLVRGPVSYDEALRITREVLAALSASHAKGIVHRDVKPANVMLGEGGSCKVMDFGIARAVEAVGTHLTRTGLVIGTVPYMAPEQAMGAAVDTRTDLYSVGVMLFELLSGRLPFPDDSIPTLLYKHVHEPPPSLASIGAPHSGARLAVVQPVLDRALAKAPDERYADAAAMRAALAPGGLHAAPTRTAAAPPLRPPAPRGFPAEAGPPPPPGGVNPPRPQLPPQQWHRAAAGPPAPRARPVRAPGGRAPGGRARASSAGSQGYGPLLAPPGPPYARRSLWAALAVVAFYVGVALTHDNGSSSTRRAINDAAPFLLASLTAIALAGVVFAVRGLIRVGPGGRFLAFLGLLLNALLTVYLVLRQG